MLQAVRRCRRWASAPGAAWLVFVDPSDGLVRFSWDLVRIFIIYPFWNTLLYSTVQLYSQAVTSYVQLSYSCKVVNKRLNNKERTYMLDIFQQSLFCISLMVLLMSYLMIYLLIMKVNQSKRRELLSKNWSLKQFLTRWSHLKIRSLFNLNNIHSSGYFQNFLYNVRLPEIEKELIDWYLIFLPCEFPSKVTWHQAAGGQQG